MRFQDYKIIFFLILAHFKNSKGYQLVPMGHSDTLCITFRSSIWLVPLACCQPRALATNSICLEGH